MTDGEDLEDQVRGGPIGAIADLCWFVTEILTWFCH